MLVYEFKSFYRKIIHQKLFFGINLVGLTIGMFFAILAFLYVQDECKYDKHFTNTDDVYLLSCNNGRNQKLHRNQPAIFMDRILENVPEVQDGIRISWQDVNMLINNIRREEIDFSYADAGIFNFLGWELVNGNADEVLEAPMTVAISEKMAKQIFGNEDPIGQIVNIENKDDFTITGVYKDFPDQAYIDVDFIASMNSFKAVPGGLLNQWGWHSSWIYLKLPEINDLEEIEKKITKVWNEHTEDIHCKGDYIVSYLQPFQDNYLKSGDITGLVDPMTYIISFSIIALLILTISCINFINLSLAVNGQRLSENQIKKVLGANKRQVMFQTIFEIFIYVLVAILLSSTILKICLSAINGFLNKHILFSLISNGELVLFLTIACIAILTACGLSSAILIFKRTNENQSYVSRTNSPKVPNGFRNSLVTVQFAIGIVLIASTIVVSQQLKLIRHHDIGFDKEQVLFIKNYEGENAKRYRLLKETLTKYPDVVSVSCGSNVPADGVNNWGGAQLVNDSQVRMEGCGFISVDYNYLDLIGAQFIEGRDFDKNRVEDIDQVIITETLAKELQLKDAVGTYLTDMWDDSHRKIVGLVKDVEYETIHEANVPIAFFCRRSTNLDCNDNILVKLKPDKLSNMLSIINDEWEKISPEYPLKYQFLDEVFNDNYLAEIRTGKLMGFMAIVAILLSAMGLFALALFHINSKIKEIGIRKVNGAKISEVMVLLNKDFVKWVVIAFIIATPIAYLAMHQWLENFAYKTELNWWIFALAGILALGIALLTVSWQSWRAATRNPVESLRYE